MHYLYVAVHDCTLLSSPLCCQVFALGHRNRATASTNMNEHSSRSHALLRVTVVGRNKETNKKTTGALLLLFS